MGFFRFFIILFFSCILKIGVLLIKDIFVDCLFAFQDFSRQMKVLMNDFTNYLNKTAGDDVFLNMEMQLKDVITKKSQEGMLKN